MTITRIERVEVRPPAETLDCPAPPEIPDDATLQGYGVIDLWLLYLDTWRVAWLCYSDNQAAAEFVNRDRGEGQ